MSFEQSEKERQESFSWSRTTFHGDYNGYLAKHKVESCIENRKGNTLLDLACGDGLMTGMLAQYFHRVVGVDANGKILAKARENNPQIRFVESLIETFELEETFDTITMLDLLEHVENPSLVLQKAASFLAEDGVLIVHVPNANAINRKLAVLMGTLTHCEELSPFDLQVAGHRRSYTTETLVQEVIDAGLKVVSTGGIFYKVLSTPQMDWFLKNGLWQGEEFGWGRVGGPAKDWKTEFCRASYELGKERPEDCNIIYACIRG